MIGADGRLAGIGAAIDELAAEELDPACAPPQSEMLLGLLEHKNRLDAEILRRIGVWDRSGDWELEGGHLHASATLGGMVRTDGLLDPEGGEIFLAALDAAEEPDSPDDPAGPRTPGNGAPTRWSRSPGPTSDTDHPTAGPASPSTRS